MEYRSKQKCNGHSTPKRQNIRSVLSDEKTVTFLKWIQKKQRLKIASYITPSFFCLGLKVSELIPVGVIQFDTPTPNIRLTGMETDWVGKNLPKIWIETWQVSLLQSVECEGAGSSVYSCHSDSLILQLRDIKVTYFKFLSRQWVNLGISRNSCL